MTSGYAGDLALSSVSVHRTRIVAWLSRHYLVCCASLALLLSLQLLPYSHLFPGDDYIHLGTLEGTVQGFGSAPFRLYEFMDGSAEHWRRQSENGPLPWFAHPEIKIKFFRPISSGLLALDHYVFGQRSWGYRIQAILWYLLLVVAHGLWARRMIPPAPGESSSAPTAGAAWHPAAMLGTLIFVVSDNQWLNVLWSAGRWVLVSAALALLGCFFYARWRQDGWRLGLPLAALTIGAGLLSGEVALAILAYPLAGEIIRAGDRAGRLRGVALLLTLSGGYLLLYALWGYGSYGTDVYLSPIAEPSKYLVQLPSRMLAMCGEVFFWIRAGSDIEAAGVAGLGLLAILLAPAFSSGSPGFRLRLIALLAGVAASMLPLASAGPNIRNLLVPFIGASVLLGLGVYSWWTILIRARTWRLRVGASLILSATCLIHLTVAPYRWLTRPADYEEDASVWKASVRKLELIDPDVRNQRVVFLTAHFGGYYSGYFLRRVEKLPMPESWLLLSAANADHIYYRATANRLEMETVGGEMMTMGIEGAMRSGNARFRVGERFHSRGLEVEILDVGKDGPTRVGFDFDRNLDDPSLVFLAGPNGNVNRIHIPAIGEKLRLSSPYR
jgi:hypothetical protein